LGISYLHFNCYSLSWFPVHQPPNPSNFPSIWVFPLPYTPHYRPPTIPYTGGSALEGTRASPSTGAPTSLFTATSAGNFLIINESKCFTQQHFSQDSNSNFQQRCISVPSSILNNQTCSIEMLSLEASQCVGFSTVSLYCWMGWKDVSVVKG